MNYIAGSDRSEVLLLPEALEDYLAAENPVRFIDAFVGQLDLAKPVSVTHNSMRPGGRLTIRAICCGSIFMVT